MHIKTSNQEAMDIGFGNYSCNWGTHICGLYQNEEERDEIIMGFLAKGAQEKDLQLYCPAERTLDDFQEKFTHNCPQCASTIEDENIFSFSTPKELYYPEGEFSALKMDENLNAFFENSQKKGKRNIRATAEMVWALDKIPGVEELMIYESRLNYFVEGKPWISICLYNVNKFSGNQILKVLQTHPFSISGGVIMQNPFYIKPDEWLKQNAPEFLK